MNHYFNSNQITDTNFPLMREGDYRVRINKAAIAFDSNDEGRLEVILNVSGTARKLTYNICLNDGNEKFASNKLQAFYNSFGIKASEQDDLNSWAGKMGAVRIKHFQLQGKTLARIAFCLDKEYQKKLPKWKEVGYIKI